MNESTGLIKREFQPAVNPASEFLEISNDFTDPKEILREAISNAFDAGAKVIKVSATISKVTGVDELILRLEDDGHGMNANDIETFFGLGFSNRRERNETGEKAPGIIGEKGHGTKIYFNSRRIELVTVRDSKRIHAAMDAPRQTLRRGELPIVIFEETTSDHPNGTVVEIFGYNANSQIGFSHGSMKDYILWFTKFGSFELQLENRRFENIVLHLRGLGHTGEPERLSFGHVFPAVNNNLA